MIRSPSQWPGHRPVVGLGGPLGDVDHVRDPVLALPGLAAGLAQRPPGAQTAGQLPAQRAARLHVQRLVDRLGGHPHLRIVGELDAQPAGDLLRRVPPSADTVLNLPAQRQVRRQLRRLRPRGTLIGQRVRRRRPIAAPARSALRRSSREIVDGERPSRAAIDRIDSPRGPGQRDLLPLGERQVAALAGRDRGAAAPRRWRPPSACPACDRCPTAAAASVMNSPRCSAAQNGCTTSGTWALTNLAINMLRFLAGQHSPAGDATSRHGLRSPPLRRRAPPSARTRHALRRGPPPRV